MYRIGVHNGVQRGILLCKIGVSQTMYPTGVHKGGKRGILLCKIGASQTSAEFQ